MVLSLRSLLTRCAQSIVFPARNISTTIILAAQCSNVIMKCCQPPLSRTAKLSCFRYEIEATIRNTYQIPGYPICIVKHSWYYRSPTACIYGFQKSSRQSRRLCVGKSSRSRHLVSYRQRITRQVFLGAGRKSVPSLSDRDHLAPLPSSR